MFFIVIDFIFPQKQLVFFSECLFFMVLGLIQYKRIIDTELNLKTGIYFIKIISNKGFQIEKIIVE